MKSAFRKWCGTLALSAVLSGSSLLPAQSPVTSKAEETLNQSVANHKSVYLLFYRESDAATQTMATVVKTQAERFATKATWTAVALTDPAERSVIDRFQVSRAPMPLVLVVHPTGIVTGAFAKQVTEANLVQALVTPKQAECMKLLQQNQLVLLCVQASAQQPAPGGVLEFRADPAYAKRTVIVPLQVSDPNEASFLAQLQIDRQSANPVTVFMAPPGVLVGQFAATATKADLVAGLTKASKCCTDANCQHNHK